MNKVLTKEQRTEIDYPLLLPLHHKLQMEDFIQKYIISDPLCSERLNDLYNKYCTFWKQEGTNEDDRLKKRAFKTTLKMLLEQTYKEVAIFSNSTGVIFAGIGITPEVGEDETSIIN